MLNSLQASRPSPCVQNGDKVVYSKYAGTELKVQGGDFVLLKVRRPSFFIAVVLCNLALDTLLCCPPITLPELLYVCVHHEIAQSRCSIAPIRVPFTMYLLEIQEEDVIGVLNSTDIAQLLPIGDRILVEVRCFPSVGLRAVS